MIELVSFFGGAFSTRSATTSFLTARILDHEGERAVALEFVDRADLELAAFQ